MRLIDADELLSDLIFPTEQFKKGFTETINDAPTIEAVPVVRCKDCKIQQTCNFAQYQGDNGFCSLAERKDEVEE